MRYLVVLPFLIVFLMTDVLTAWAQPGDAAAEDAFLPENGSMSHPGPLQLQGDAPPKEGTSCAIPLFPASQATASQAIAEMLPDGLHFTLEEAINRSLEANRTVLDATDGVERARLFIVSAESEFELKFIPVAEAGFSDGSNEASQKNLGAGISLQKNFPTGTFITLEPSVSKTGDIYQTRVDSSLSQPLLRGSDREYNLSGVRAAEFGNRSARRSLYLTRVNTITSTVRAVYDIILQQRIIQVNEESFARLKRHVEAARVKERFGLATPIDVYRAEIQLKQAEDNLANAREAYLNSLDNLKVILALPPEIKIDVSAPLKYSLIHMDEDESVKISLQNRVELKQAWDAMNEAERRSRVAKHNVLPDLDIVLSFAPFGDSSDFDADLNEYVWGVSLSSSTDLRRTRERALYDQSLLDANSARRNLSLIRDEITREAKTSLRALQKAQQRIDIQEQQIKTAQSKLKLAQVKFKHGMASNFDLIETEEQLRQAQTRMISVVVDYIVGTYNLRAATGTLLEKEAGL